METQHTQSFGDVLRRHRLAAGLTQEGLAERAGLSVRGVEYLERRAGQVPRKDTVELLAGALGLEGREYAAFKLAAKRGSVPDPERPVPETVASDDVTAPVHTLPSPLTSFVGREREIGAAARMLPREDVRLLTLTGPGGVGKTRLALEVARRVAEGFPDGVRFTDLSPVADPGLVPSAVARSLGILEVPGQPILESLNLHLQGARALLVLDNFEQVVESAPLLVELLAACPRLTVLVTSRALLRVSGERRVPVPPMQIPALGEPIDAESLLRYDAVRLFVDRVGALDTQFALTDENAQVVADICRRLDGLPLALELAAARSNLLSLADILSRLQHSLGLLTAGARDLPERQRTIRATIEWSHGLLGEEERLLFRRLGVFAGGWTLDAAESVCGESQSELAVPEALGTLVDSNLVRRDTGGHPETRYLMLESVREYAVERLRESGEEEALGRRHADHYLATAVAFGTEPGGVWVGPERDAWLPRFRSEYPNFRAAVYWYANRGEAERALRLADNLFLLWGEDGQLTEGRRLLERALAAEGAVSAPMRARVLKDFIGIWWQTGDESGPRAYLEAALARDREQGNQERIADGLATLAYLALMRREYRLAAGLAEESAALYRRTGNKNPLTRVLCTAGKVAAELGEHGRARSIYEEALAVARELGDEFIMARIVGLQGWTALVGGDIERATELYEESLALHLRLGERRDIERDLEGLGLAALVRGDYPLAVAHLEEHLALMRSGRRVGLSMLLAYGLRLLAWAVSYAGDVSRARELLREALVMSEELGDRRGVAAELDALAGIAAAEGSAQEAARIFGIAEGLRTAIGSPADQVERLIRGRCLSAVRDALGQEAFEEAYAEGRAMTKDEGVAYALGHVGLLSSD